LTCSADVLRSLYVDQKLTQAEIGERIGVSQVQVGRMLRAANIPVFVKSDRLCLPDVSPRLQEILVGSLLGDGSMSTTGRHTARFSEGHAVGQAGYLEWKAAEFGAFVSSTYATKKVDADGREHHGVGFTTHGCRQFRPWMDLFYPDGRRVFPAGLPGLLTPLALAVWYMDDGNLMSRFHPRIAFGLCDVSLHRALDGLVALGLRPVVHGRGGRTAIHFPGQVDAFFGLVRPYVGEVPGMRYKLPLESARRRVVRNAHELSSERVALLLSQGESKAAVARAYGVSRSTVGRRARSGVGAMGRPAGGVPGGRLADLTREELVGLYAVESDEAIGGRYGVSGALISRRRRMWGIPTKVR